MLYITTRNKADAFTYPHALASSHSADGGFFAPFHLPEFSPEELTALKERSFGEIVAKMMNLFFKAGLEAGDIEFTIGRNPIRTVSISHRICICETWHNPDANYNYLIRQLSSRIWLSAQEPSFWFKIAVRIAVHFCAYSQMLAQGTLQPGACYDIAVRADDFYDLPSAFYAKKMGLPIGVIICGCNDDVFWNLLNRGSLSTKNLSADSKTRVEQLLFCAFDCTAVCDFVACCEKESTYFITAQQKEKLAEVMFAAVVTDNRIDSVINSVYKTNEYAIDSKRVIPIAALQDYRAKIGESRITVCSADASAIYDRTRICSAANITQERLAAIINKT